MSKTVVYKILIIWMVLMAATALIGKTTIAADNGRAVADFLNIGVGARSAALGGAYTSVTDGADAVYWNPGGLTAVSQTQIMFSHFSWYQDINYEFLGVAHPVSDRITLAFGGTFLSYGDIEGYDRFDSPTGQVESTFDLAAGLSLGYKLSDKLSMGLTGKYIMLSLAGEKASALAVDIGARYREGMFSFGLTAANLGTGMKFNDETENLPVAIRGGMAVRPWGSTFTAALEMEHQFYGVMSISNGYELVFEERYFLRAGYRIIPAQDGRELGHSPSFGAGAILGPATIDYTFSPEEKYSSENIHRFSIIFML